MPSRKTDIAEFLRLAEAFPVIDVRSPGEYIQGHIPGAFNIPLFDDAERAAVGTSYTKEGRNQAIIEGLKLTGPSMYTKLENALKLAREGKLLVHCWRGGMRSEAMAWLFSLGQIESVVLEGGYKTYRHHVNEILSAERQMIILGGMTGSSKTHILRYLGEKGHQVIDMEGMAHHKGSAFGSLGQTDQPTTEQFANDLHYRWMRLDPGLPVWLEDESRNIGTVFLPDAFYMNMQKAPTVILMMDIKTRMPRLMEEYSGYPPELLKGSVMKISRRMGGDKAKEAAEAIDSGNISRAIEITLQYYDKAYRHSIEMKNNKDIIYLETCTDDVEANAEMIMEAVKGKFPDI
jgi:tRNA 2-selenouridine synthase